jgi:hypothetical protein
MRAAVKAKDDGAGDDALSGDDITAGTSPLRKTCSLILS